MREQQALPEGQRAAASPAPVEGMAAPSPTLRIIDTVALTVGIVLGAGIFKAPSLVAAQTGSGGAMLLAWLLGGVASLVGALCYAELASAWPHPGGEYHYLSRALGRGPAFLFAWARLTVIPTGSIALLAFVFGDYATQLVSLGPYSSSVYAAAVVVGLTAVNIAGLRQGTRTQNLLTALEVLGVGAVIVAGLLLAPASASAAPVAAPSGTSWGLAMVFVLLTYGGWNEVAYLSAEVRGTRRSLARALLVSIGVVTALYLLVNWAYLRGLGHAGMAGSEAVAADLMKRALGTGGAVAISVLIAISALTSANATVLTGARTHYAFGRDSVLFNGLGRWHARANTPTRALLAQGAITLALVGLGTVTRQGFQTMVEYTAPVFWLFFLLTGVSLLVLRVREPGAHRPFRVPLYPLTPLLFVGICAYVLYSSLAYTGPGALAGLAVLGTGAVLLAVEVARTRRTPRGSQRRARLSPRLQRPKEAT
ncbi:APC family permease [Myxococcus sp. RHSTA-1-4]|uniref:APC family permease n=1 Tax=Myxococcus sp. RHSTA-1-4 TaxID=2874601 RepID=UPI001CBD2C36|nr:amino acid permease [Myxococcus sp. RHSTA-1-4]MBZ4422202.1 amino acid permease [Myxococcus sp. RHSTA-1-4]